MRGGESAGLVSMQQRSGEIESDTARLLLGGGGVILKSAVQTSVLTGADQKHTIKKKNLDSMSHLRNVQNGIDGVER